VSQAPVNRPRAGAHVAESEPAGNYSGRSRIFWTFSDQALSSLTNAALAIVVARTVSKGDFGAFALALTTYGFVVGLVRAFVGEPFVVRFSASEGDERRRGMAHASGTAVSLGAVAAVICLIVAAVIGGVAGSAFVALALAMPGLMLQDTWRHMFFSAGRPAAATMNDLVWTVLQFGLLWMVLSSGDDSIFLITLVWGISALVAAAVGCFQTGVLPAPQYTWSWLKETKDIGIKLGLGFSLNMGAVNLVTYLIAGIVGLAATGALRAAQTVLGPVNLLFGGFNAFVLPVLSRAAATGGRLLRPAVLGSGLLAGVTGTWVAILVLLPDSIGRMILKDSWAGASTVMLPSGLLMLAGALVLGASNSLVALSRSDLMLRITSMQAPLMLAFGVIGAWQGGVVAATYGLVLAQTIGLAYCWYLFLKAEADPRRWAEVSETVH
jgi:O-antigen/teichoic acid export membrane protein